MSPSYRVLVAGTVSGELLRLDGPLSLWGGLDPETGLIIDHNHPQHGETMTGRIVVMPHGRGSSSSSSVLAEALRSGTGPAGFVLDEPDGILVIGSLVAARLYGTTCPIVCGPAPRSAGPWRIEGDRVLPLSENGGGGGK